MKNKIIGTILDEDLEDTLLLYQFLIFFITDKLGTIIDEGSGKKRLTISLDELEHLKGASVCKDQKKDSVTFTILPRQSPELQ